jgi:hypothetical protein
MARGGRGDGRLSPEFQRWGRVYGRLRIVTDGAGPANRVRPVVDGFHNFLKEREHQ